MWLRALVFALAGMLAALYATWQPVLEITTADAGPPVEREVLERLRTEPDDSLLVEIHNFAVGTPVTDRYGADRALRESDELIQVLFDTAGGGALGEIPRARRQSIFSEAGSDFWDSRFGVPSLLARAYRASGDLQYLHAAVEYVLGWAEYESSEWIMRGFVFDDYAIPVRAIVTTEVWRLYRTSEIYTEHDAAQLISYIQKLAMLLAVPKLYQYHSNHGIMQNLSLLHIAVAYPHLPERELIASTGRERLRKQLPHFVNREGGILEHSAAYHRNGLRRLTSAWRYLSLLGDSVPEDMIERYAKAIELTRTMLRPDQTLPPIGDSTSDVFSPHRVARFDDDGMVNSEPLPYVIDDDIHPVRSTILPAMGLAIFWNGLNAWPTAEDLAQTTFHWGNFPSQVHKHADELSLTIWFGGAQWVQGVNYWPYDQHRYSAIGWTGTNAPHWRGESSAGERSSRLLAYADSEYTSFVDLERRNADRSGFRRQVASIGGKAWAVVDKFDSSGAGEAEVIWRFSPNVNLSQSGEHTYRLENSDLGKAMSVTFASSRDWVIEADQSGNADWNHGVRMDDDIVPSAAMRLTTAVENPLLLSFFRRLDSATEISPTEAMSISYHDDENWALSIARDSPGAAKIARTQSQLTVAGFASADGENSISYETGEVSDRIRAEALESFGQATAEYGHRFHPKVLRRTKVTYVVMLGAVVQLLLFGLIARQWSHLRTTYLALSTLGWAGLALFLHFHYLV